MRRRRIIRMLGTTAAALSLVPLAASGATPVPGVDASDFPSVGQVAHILPDYAGGERYVEKDHPVWIFEGNCLSYRNGPSGEVRKWAYYYGTDSDAPSLPRVHVQQFSSVTDAQRAIRTIRRNSQRCYGTHHSQFTTGTFIRRAADVPSLGDGTPAAWKMNDHWTDQDTGIDMVYFSRRIWMREAETVIGVDLWGSYPQSRNKAIRLARLALRTVD